ADAAVDPRALSVRRWAALQGDWIERLAQLPPRGLVISGTQDPYVPLDTLSRFAQRHGAPLHVEQDAGHWSIVERPQSIAAALRRSEERRVGKEWRSGRWADGRKRKEERLDYGRERRGASARRIMQSDIKP